MKAAVLKNARELVIEDVPDPQIAGDEVLVKVAACGICGTDLHLYKHGSLSPDARIGHESAGTVADIGKGVKGFGVGDRVAVLGRVPCGECHWCVRGRHHVCPTRLDVRGGFSEYVAVKPQMLAPLPDEISFRQAAVMEPMAVSLHGIRLAQISPPDGVVITGAGPIGLFAAALLRDIGVRGLVVSEPSEKRREIASIWADRGRHGRCGPRGARPGPGRDSGMLRAGTGAGRSIQYDRFRRQDSYAGRVPRKHQPQPGSDAGEGNSLPGILWL